uniref:uncharacterized protein LOC120340491 n=1 Tax=Styela clava TaxID=7725 RepID=UPI001939674F|nr:uncharacterized protein LOC120340491 [Styela clava]
MSPFDIFRLIIPSNPLLSVTLLLCFFNYLLLLMNYNYKQVCSDETFASEGRSRQRRGVNDFDHWNVQEKNQFWVVEMAKYSTFNWESEMERLFEIIPVMEMRTDSVTPDDAERQIPIDPNEPTQWGQNLSKSHKLPLVTEYTNEELIALEMKRINSNFTNIYQNLNKQSNSKWHLLKENALLNGLLNCREISQLEYSRKDPRIKYNFRSLSKWKGDIKISSTVSVPILLRNFVKKKTPPESSIEKMNYPTIARKSDKQYFDKSFERAKTKLLNLLKMQGWYGIPRLYGLCITSSSGDDVTDAILNPTKGTPMKVSDKIRYIVARHDEGTTLCDSYYASFECQRLHPVMRLTNTMDKPPLAAITIMYNTAKLFEQFWKHGAVLYDLLGTDFKIDSNLDVMITDTSSVKFLPRNECSESSHIQRLLSDTICTESTQCELVSWQTNSISLKLGMHCGEVRGYCKKNRCWGIDSHVHACILSRWFFTKLHAVIPTSWSHDEDLNNLIQCGSSNAPDERCDWTQLKTGLKQIYDIAKKEWAPK